MKKYSKEKSPFISKKIRNLSEEEKVILEKITNIQEGLIDEDFIGILPGFVSHDEKPRSFVINNKFFEKIRGDHGDFDIENLVLSITDWDYLLKNIKGDPDRINLIKLIPNSHHFFIIGAKRVNGFFMLTYFEYHSKYGNELKNLLEKGSVLDRFGRTPKSTTKP